MSSRLAPHPDSISKRKIRLLVRNKFDFISCPPEPCPSFYLFPIPAKAMAERKEGICHHQTVGPLMTNENSGPPTTTLTFIFYDSNIREKIKTITSCRRRQSPINMNRMSWWQLDLMLKWPSLSVAVVPFEQINRHRKATFPWVKLTRELDYFATI